MQRLVIAGRKTEVRIYKDKWNLQVAEEKKLWKEDWSVIESLIAPQSQKEEATSTEVLRNFIVAGHCSYKVRNKYQQDNSHPKH